MILDALQPRLRALLARPVASGPELEKARFLVATLGEDGTWNDGRALALGEHLRRVETLARLRVAGGEKFDAAIGRALDFWLAQDPPETDGRQHQIALPRLVGTTALLCADILSEGAREKVAEVLARPRWTRWHQGGWKPWAGGDLAAVGFNILLRACFEDTPSRCHEAFERMYAAIRVAPDGGDGIQSDLSFRQDDGASLADRHGLSFSIDSARLLVLGHGTTWQAPPKCLALFAAFLLDGQQWVIRRRFLDADPTGEESLFAFGVLDRFAEVVEELALLGVTPRRAEMAAFARRLRLAPEPALSGHRHFWRAGFTVHQRPAFYASVRLVEESGPHVDGSTWILRHGDEPGDRSLWDQRRLPGTTTFQSPASSDNDAADVQERGFTGGVTDGEHGVVAVELRRGAISGRKVWFHLDDAVACLGSDITCDDAAGPVSTSINQCLARGPATAYGKGGETHDLIPGKSYDLSAARRLEHDGIAYHFPTPLAVRARIAPPGGHRGGSDAPSPEVLTLWIDHGLQPRHEPFVYTMAPVAPEGSRVSEHELSPLRILANTSACQAVWHQELRLLGVVFWEPGTLALPDGGRVAANRACVLLGQDRKPEGMRLSIANPAREPATIHVEYANRCVCFNLLAGPLGGPSVTRVT